MVFSFLEFLSRFAMVGSVGRGASRSTLVYSSINGIISVCPSAFPRSKGGGGGTARLGLLIAVPNGLEHVRPLGSFSRRSRRSRPVLEERVTNSTGLSHAVTRPDGRPARGHALTVHCALCAHHVTRWCWCVYCIRLNAKELAPQRPPLSSTL